MNLSARFRRVAKAASEDRRLSSPFSMRYAACGADANSLRKLNRVNFCKLPVTDNVVVNYVPWFASHVRRRVLS